jgi:hypothetical protein
LSRGLFPTILLGIIAHCFRRRQGVLEKNSRNFSAVNRPDK